MDADRRGRVHARGRDRRGGRHRELRRSDGDDARHRRARRVLPSSTASSASRDLTGALGGGFDESRTAAARPSHRRARRRRARGARACTRSSQGTVRWVKVGMTLFYAEGPQIVGELRDLGFDVFLDLKLHDIPHQVRGAARSVAAARRADAHRARVRRGSDDGRGGRGRCEGAAEAGVDAPAVIAVTVLTSIDDDSARRGRRAADRRRAGRAARGARARGGVRRRRGVLAAGGRARCGSCSARRRSSSRPAFGPLGGAGDQARVATPAEALDGGREPPRRRPADHRRRRSRAAAAQRILARDGGGARERDRMTDDEMLEALQDAGAIRHGHFVLTSGRHCDTLRAVRARSRGPGAHDAARARPPSIDFRRNCRSTSSPLRRSAGSSSVSPSRRRWGSSSSSASARTGKMVFRRSFEVPARSSRAGGRRRGHDGWERCRGHRPRASRRAARSPALSRSSTGGGRRRSSADYWPLLRLEVESWEPASCCLCARPVCRSTRPGVASTF